MKTSESYLPEGSYITQPAVREALCSPDGLRRAQSEGRILEAVAQRCTAEHDLLFDLGFAQGVMPRSCCALGVAEGDTREIAILSRVGKPTCFAVTGVEEDADPPTVWLSRTIVQQRAQDYLLDTLRPGDVIPARVTHLEPFGAFVDIGCGVPSLIGIENLSVSRIFHPRDRLCVGQDIFAAVRAVDTENRRIALTHRELLGTWEQNAALFAPGETVRGVVRSVEPYGVFIELAPNLSGLAEPRGDLTVGMVVSVYIKSILPQRMKVKLTVIDVLAPRRLPLPPHYFITEGHIDSWVYTPACCDKKYVATVF
ncbi:MAG: S1 RNA-binding domain-containing protein [Agathobaculum sp.]|uniref:S1 RNA-binding domain-containing protein n=1 Tax=Agathobaculum sp. TaxID=2048138 RepID=UPI0025C2EE70|nr:S1 RNA-binding domain-containing protein [Agathobaculum sp.]MCI7126421.1 S1 RNA-binding domain-containing protein [Agathobaculum sp.]MDY3712409.1 S1 RNA-binding domain-containing protein [Agathobaculum sp.]